MAIIPRLCSDALQNAGIIIPSCRQVWVPTPFHAGVFVSAGVPSSRVTAAIGLLSLCNVTIQSSCQLATWGVQVGVVPEAVDAAFFDPAAAAPRRRSTAAAGGGDFAFVSVFKWEHRKVPR